MRASLYATTTDNNEFLLALTAAGRHCLIVSADYLLGVAVELATLPDRCARQIRFAPVDVVVVSVIDTTVSYKYSDDYRI